VIVPGDYAYADSSGAVVIPADSVRRVVQEAARIESDEDRAAEQIQVEDPGQVRRGDR
jgi:regulator of RNase E activity RraA